MFNNFEYSPKFGQNIRHIEDLSQEVLTRYLKLWNSSDFEPNTGIEIPYDPTFLQVASLKIQGVKIAGRPDEYADLILQDVNVFFCHGESDESGMWTERDRLSIPELLTEFKTKHDLVACLSCNPGSFRLDDELIYPIGTPPPIPCCFNGKDGITLDAHLAFEHPNFRPVFHIPERYLKG